MAFEKGNQLGANYQREKHGKGVMPAATDIPTTDDIVMDETLESALNRDEIVPKAPEKPVAKEKEVVIPQLPETEDLDLSVIHGWSLAELDFTDPGLVAAPNPPKCIMEWCKSRDLVWRWLSYPAVKHKGMRGYVALSVLPEWRKKIRLGDCPATVDIDVSNKLVWREDAFLGVIPRRLHEARQKAKAQRTLDQTKLSRNSDGLQEMAARAGGKLVEYKVDETTRQGL